MDTNATTSPVRKRLIAAALAAGTMLGAVGIAGAVTGADDSTDDAPNASDDRATTANGDKDTDADGSDGRHEANDETPLTGDLADDVTAAALAAVPGGTIVRVETDDHGAAYEAHMTDADGAPVTVTFDENLEVIEIMADGRGHEGEHDDDDDERDDDGEHGDALLTGALADDVTAAALAAVPGGTVLRVEEEDGGYEAHVTDAEGNEVEVYLDADLNVLDIEQDD